MEKETPSHQTKAELIRTAAAVLQFAFACATLGILVYVHFMK